PRFRPPPRWWETYAPVWLPVRRAAAIVADPTPLPQVPWAAAIRERQIRPPPAPRRTTPDEHSRRNPEESNRASSPDRGPDSASRRRTTSAQPVQPRRRMPSLRIEDRNTAR